MSRLLPRSAAALLAAALVAGCINTDPNTGEPAPRGGQRYEFSEVQRNAEKLENGMTQLQVLYLLGSPAEESERKDVWVYLPERYGILIPAKALRLQFRDKVLVDFGYRPIILGERL